MDTLDLDVRDCDIYVAELLGWIETCACHFARHTAATPPGIRMPGVPQRAADRAVVGLQQVLQAV